MTQVQARVLTQTGSYSHVYTQGHPIFNVSELRIILFLNLDGLKRVQIVVFEKNKSQIEGKKSHTS